VARRASSDFFMRISFRYDVISFTKFFPPIHRSPWGYTAQASSIDNIPNVEPQWATISISRYHSISPETRSPRHFSVSSGNVSMTLRKYILRDTRKSMASGDRSFGRPLISF
jgi:hypothetical protein